MTNDNYNGWTNYETWCVKLWIDSEQGSNEYWHDSARETFENSRSSEYSTRGENARRNLADSLKEHYDELKCELMPASGVFTDLLNSALSGVNWFEIAESLLGDVGDDY